MLLHRRTHAMHGAVEKTYWQRVRGSLTCVFSLGQCLQPPENIIIALESTNIILPVKRCDVCATYSRAQLALSLSCKHEVLVSMLQIQQEQGLFSSASAPRLFFVSACLSISHSRSLGISQTRTLSLALFFPPVTVETHSLLSILSRST